MSTSAPIGPPPHQQIAWIGPPFILQQGCADGFHAWVPWLRLDTGTFITWCTREGCEHREQFDP